MNIFLKLITIFFLGFTLSTRAFSSSITVENAFARASIGMAKNGAVFMSIHNHSNRDERLLAIKTDIAAKSSLHKHVNKDGVMKMLVIAHINIPKNGHIDLKPGGLHVMLVGLKAPLIEGKQFNITLFLKNSGDLTIPVQVKKIAEMGHYKKTKHTH